MIYIYNIESVVFHVKAKIYVQKNDKTSFQTCFHFFQISDLRFEISDFRFEFQISGSDFRLKICWGNLAGGSRGNQAGRRVARAFNLSHCIKTL